jgi:hypothetical protein
VLIRVVSSLGRCALEMDKDTSQPGTLPIAIASRPKSPSDQPALAVTYLRCLELYQNLLHLLGMENCRVACLKQVNVSKVLEEYGRFRIWGEQTRAAIPEKTRGSLDETLRNDERLKSAVSSILGQLFRHLQMGRASRDQKSSHNTDHY